MSGTVRGGCSATPGRVERARQERVVRGRVRAKWADTPFDHMTVAELRTWAQRYDVENYGKINKEDLADAVRMAYEEGSRV